jgi:hypothetical protein
VIETWKLTVILPRGSMASIVSGNELDFSYAGDELRKGIDKLDSPNASLDAIFLLEALLDTAHHRNCSVGSGMASTVGFVMNSGEVPRTISSVTGH